MEDQREKRLYAAVQAIQSGVPLSAAMQVKADMAENVDKVFGQVTPNRGHRRAAKKLMKKLQKKAR